MDINQFIYFGEICRAGSLSRAAENLHLSQQGLSLSIRRLEAELGCQLFFRRPNGLELTDAGQVFRRESEAVLEHVNRIYQYCETTKGKRSRITVACTMNMITRIPASLRHLLLRGNEDFEINFIEDWNTVCEEMVSDNRANFGLVYGACDTELFHSTTLDVFKQVFIVNRSSPLAEKDEILLQELADYPLIVPPERCRPGAVIRDMFRRAGVPLQIVYTCDRPRQIIDLVSSDKDVGARVILDDVTEKDLERVKVLRLADDPFLQPVCLIYKKGRSLSMQERYFSHLVIDAFRHEG